MSGRASARPIGFFGIALAVVASLIVSTPGASQAASVVVLDIAANAIVYDEINDVVFAAVDDRAAQHANTVVKLDPNTGAVLGSLPVGSDPGPLALSNNSEYLYVGLQGAPTVVRVALPAFTVDLQIPLGIDPTLGWPRYADDIAVLPLNPTSVAVAMRFQGTSPPGAGVAVFDDAVQRPSTTPRHVGENSIIFSGPRDLYGADLCCSGREFYEVTVDGDGVTRTASHRSLGGSELVAARNGRIYSDDGKVVDVNLATPTIAGTFPIEGRFSAGAYSSATQRFVTVSELFTGQSNTPMLLEKFDLGTFTRVERTELPRSTLTPLQLVETRTLAFVVLMYDRTNAANNEIHLIGTGASPPPPPPPPPPPGQGTITGTVTDHHTGVPVGGICVVVFPFNGEAFNDAPRVADAETASNGRYAVAVPAGVYELVFVDCSGWDYAAVLYGEERVEPVTVENGGVTDASLTLAQAAQVGLVNTGTGRWFLSRARDDIVEEFFFGNPGDAPMVGDWDCDGTETPGLYRREDGFVYLRNSNSQGIADVRFFFGNPGDLPLAGDFNGDGCHTVSIYRPATSQVFIINKLGANEGGLGAADIDYFFGNPGDKPYVGDFDADGVDTVGLHRETTGLVYYRNSHTQGPAEEQFIFGDPGDRIVAGNFDGFHRETPAIFRPSDTTFYIRHENAAGPADRTVTFGFADAGWLPVAGTFGL